MTLWSSCSHISMSLYVSLICLIHFWLSGGVMPRPRPWLVQWELEERSLNIHTPDVDSALEVTYTERSCKQGKPSFPPFSLCSLFFHFLTLDTPIFYSQSQLWTWRRSSINTAYCWGEKVEIHKVMYIKRNIKRVSSTVTSKPPFLSSALSNLIILTHAKGT